MNIQKQFDIFQMKRAEIVQKEMDLSENLAQIKSLQIIIEQLLCRRGKLEDEINSLYYEMTALAGTLPPFLEGMSNEK